MSRLGGRTAAELVAVYRADARRTPHHERARVEQLAAGMRDDFAEFGVTHPADAAMGLALGLMVLHAELGIPHSRRIDNTFGRLWAAAAVILEAEGVQ